MKASTSPCILLAVALLAIPRAEIPAERTVAPGSLVVFQSVASTQYRVTGSASEPANVPADLAAAARGTPEPETFPTPLGRTGLVLMYGGAMMYAAGFFFTIGRGCYREEEPGCAITEVLAAASLGALGVGGALVAADWISVRRGRRQAASAHAAKEKDIRASLAPVLVPFGMGRVAPGLAFRAEF